MVLFLFFFFQSFHVWFFLKSWSFEPSPLHLILSMPSPPSPLSMCSPLSLISLWSCFSIINLESSLFSSVLVSCCKFCLSWTLLLLQLVLSGWSILFATTIGPLSFWLILSVVVVYPLEVVLLTFGTDHIYDFILTLVLVLTNSLLLP
jgi:hypothetical protein